MSSKEFVTGLYGYMGAAPAADKSAKKGRDHFLTHCHESIQWTVHGPSELSKCGLFKGRDGVADFFTKLDENWKFTAPIKFLDTIATEDARAVIVTTEEHGINRITKEPFVARGCHLWNLSKTREGQKPDCPVGKAYTVLGFTEWLCVYNGKTGMANVPPVGSDVGVASEEASCEAVMPERATVYKDLSEG